MAPPRPGRYVSGHRGPGAAITGRPGGRASPLWAAPVTGATAALPPCGPRPSLGAIFKLRWCRSHWAQREEPVRTAGPQGDAPRGEAATGTAVRLARGGGRRGPGGVAGPPGRFPEGGSGGGRRRDRPTVRPCGGAAGPSRWLAGWTRKCPGEENGGSTFQAESWKDDEAAPAHPLRGARAAGFGV